MGGARKYLGATRTQEFLPVRRVGCLAALKADTLLPSRRKTASRVPILSKLY